MMMRATKTWYVALAGLVLAAGLAGSGVRAAGVEKVPLAVIVNKASPVNDLSMSELRNLFLGERQTWPAGGKVVPYVLPPDSAEHQGFAKIVLGMTGDELARFWIDRRIRGNGVEPKVVPSVLMINRIVGQTVGAVSYVRGAQVTEMVKVVSIDGKLPSDPGYPLLATVESR
jgi:hypothetical protein